MLLSQVCALCIKAGFHWRRSQSRSRSSCKSASDLPSFRNRKRSHKLDGVGRIRTVPFFSDSAYDSDAYDPVKTRLSDWLQTEVLGLFFGFHLRLRQSSFHWIISVGVISGIGRLNGTILTPLATPIFDFH